MDKNRLQTGWTPVMSVIFTDLGSRKRPLRIKIFTFSPSYLFDFKFTIHP